MTSFNENLTKYAELAVKVGVNIQEGQNSYITAAGLLLLHHLNHGQLKYFQN